jgi:putative thioredoxin
MSDAQLLEFWAPWCKPCERLVPVLEELARRVEIVRVNADEEPDLAARHDVLSLPTCVLVVDGEPRGSVIGVRPLAYFESWLDEVLPPAEGGLDA